MTHLAIATLICHPARPALSQALMKRIADVIGKTTFTWLDENVACDVSLPAGMAAGEARALISGLTEGLPVDIVIHDQANRKKKALIADMDSTMIDQECIDELAAEIGAKDKVAEITAKAMNGEIEFEPALRERVALLKGLPASISQQVIANRITLASGGKTLVATMKHHGNWCTLVSGGFTLFTGPIGAMIGFDENHANILETDNERLTGTVREPILGADAKVAALHAIAARRNLSPADFIAVGDGANDLPMLETAGTGVALHAKPSVAARAKIRIDHGDLTSLLYLQGYKRGEFRHAVTD